VSTDVRLGTPEAPNDRVGHLLGIDRVVAALDPIPQLLQLHQPRLVASFEPASAAGLVSDCQNGHVNVRRHGSAIR
jgi:hypothetical protein